MPVIKQDKNKAFTLPVAEYKPLSAKETEDLFGDNEEYLIKGVKNFPLFE